MTKTSGKVILSGEHAVVYGKTAIAASISLGVEAMVVNEAEDQSELIKYAIRIAGGEPSICIKVTSNLPSGSGLGSSAAVACATIRVVREHLGKPITDEELFNLVWETEKLFSPRDSGLDSTMVTYGGLIEYVKGKPFKQLVINKAITILLVNSGTPSETTGELVRTVADDSTKLSVIEEIGSVSEQIKEKLLLGEGIESLINQNGLLLEKLGVVGGKATNLSSELRALGASVKITGAGGVKAGSGMMIVMKDDLTQIKKLLDNRQIEYFETTIGGQ